MKRNNFFKDASVLVTGGVGSVGKEIVKQLLQLPVKKIRVIDNNESGIFEMEMAMKNEPRVEAFHADICDEHELNRAFSGMDYCFHTAALKHVPSCEVSPFGAVNVNITGVKNIINAAQFNQLKKVLFTSSDKAVNPPNVMGATKLMGERLFTAANFMPAFDSGVDTVFASTRFGNVVGSRGSVIPLFKNQIKNGGPVTVTDENMTRFVMSLEESAELVIESMIYAHSGDVFITKMPVLNINDLAEVMIDKLAAKHGHNPQDIEIKIIGSRVGEKLYEELSTSEESRRILEGEKYLCVRPIIDQIQEKCQNADYSDLGLKPSTCVYSSETEEKMTHTEIANFLEDLKIL